MESTLSKTGKLGSPPRVRGTGQHRVRDRVRQGITPACAGNSFMAYSTAMLTQDHPRVCGEQVSFAACWHSRLGSPRVCGEQQAAQCRAKDPQGSPPRVRGTAVGIDLLSSQFRITPACAGNSSGPMWWAISAWDHPRVCGEQPATPALRSRVWGSPPRVRGTAYLALIQARVHRITPACAGNRSPARAPSTWSPDHPRVCGEQPVVFRRAEAIAGSPPRVRGTVHCNSVKGRRKRITPACAGNRS